MRIELGRIKDVPRGIVIAGAALAFGAAACVWMFMDLSKREATIAQLSTEANAKQEQVNSIPPLQPIRPDENSLELLNSMVMSQANEPELFEQLSRLASDNGLEEVTINSDPPTTIEDPSLVALGINRQLNLKIDFKAEYPDAARFLGSIGSLQRSIVIRDVQLRRAPPKVGATLSLQVYQKG